MLSLGTAITGVAAGLGYCYSLQVLNEFAPADKRSEVVSTYLIACCCGISLPVIGLLTKATSSRVAHSVFAVMIALVAVGVLIFQWRRGRGTRRSA